MIVPRPEVKLMLNEFRFKRFLKPSKHLPRCPNLCAWCGGKGRKGLKYCSDDCQSEVNIRYTGSWVIYYVFQRDHGICSLCGIDTEEIRKEALIITKLSWNFPESRKHWGPWQMNNYTFWEADHIVPIYQGGGVCGLDNYRTLCVPCHKNNHKTINRNAIKREGVKV